MLHDAVLPGAPIIGEPCPGCHWALPRRATLGFRIPTVEDAYKAALAGDPAPLLKLLDPSRHSATHGTVPREGQEFPCPFLNVPSWLLGQCSRPEEVTAWLVRLEQHGWWLPAP